MVIELNHHWLIDRKIEVCDGHIVIKFDRVAAFDSGFQFGVSADGDYSVVVDEGGLDFYVEDILGGQQRAIDVGAVVALHRHRREVEVVDCGLSGATADGVGGIDHVLSLGHKQVDAGQIAVAVDREIFVW